MTEHTVKSFTEQLEGLSALVAQMGGLAEAQFAAAIEAIARRDSARGGKRGGRRRPHRRHPAGDRGPRPEAAGAAPAHGGGSARDPGRDQDRRRTGTHRRSGQEHRQARPGAEPRAAHPPDPSPGPHGPRGAEPAQAGAGRLFQPQRRTGRSGVEPGRRDRRNLQQPVPRTSHLHDGRSAHHRACAPIFCSSPRTSSARGDHATNIAEVVYHMVTRRPSRHRPAQGRHHQRTPPFRSSAKH